MKSISVIIPTYNRAKMIEKSVKSVASQEGLVDLFDISEIIVVDDASTDNTREIVDAIDVGKVNLMYHRLEKNSGASKARNEGVLLSKGEWVAFQDSDDEWLPIKLKTMTEFMQQNPGADLYSHYYEARLEGNKSIVVDAPSTEDFFAELSKRNFIGAPAFLVKKQAFFDVGCFDEEIPSLEDWDFVLRFSYDHKIMVVPEVLMRVDLVSEGISSNAGNYYESRCRIIAKNKKELLERNTFEIAVEKLLSDAKEKGILPQVGKMLEYYLSR